MPRTSGGAPPSTDPDPAFSVRPGVADDWDQTVGPVPATLRRRWITLAEARIPGGAHTFALTDVALTDVARSDVARTGQEPDRPGGQLSVAVVGGVMEAASGHVRFDPYQVLSGRSVHEGVVAQGPHPWKDLAPEDVFPCGLLMFPNYETTPVGPGRDDPKAVRRFVGGLVDWAREQGLASIAALFLRQDCPEFHQALRETGFDLVPMVDRCDLAVTWSDFDGYLAGLPRKRRFAVRRELREIAERDVVLSERTLNHDEPELLRLRAQLVTKYGGTPDLEREAGSLRHLREHFGDRNLVVVEARLGTDLLSFSIFIRDGAHWTVLMSGTDHERPDASFTYFATMFYRPAQLAPAEGITSIAYGLGTVQAKKLRGCDLNPLSAAALLLR